MNNEEFISHHGILGQRWGIRRYQNSDGSLTPAGRRRAQKLKGEYKSLTGKKLKGSIPKESPDGKPVKKLTDTELKDRITRLRNEKEALGLERDLSSNGKKFVRSVGKDVVAPAAINAGKNLLEKMFFNIGSKALGLDGKEVKDAYQELKKSTEVAELKARKAKAEQSFKQTMEQEKNRQAKKEQQTQNQNNRKSNDDSTFVYNDIKINVNKSNKETRREYEDTGKSVMEAVWREVNDDERKGQKLLGYK